MIQWRIYYSDGSTFDSSQGIPDDAPAFGVAVIVQLADNGRLRDSVHSGDYYVYTESGFWVGADLSGLLDRLANRIPFSGFLVGRWDPQDEYFAILRKAEKDPDFPQARN